MPNWIDHAALADRKKFCSHSASIKLDCARLLLLSSYSTITAGHCCRASYWMEFLYSWSDAWSFIIAELCYRSIFSSLYVPLTVSRWSWQFYVSVISVSVQFVYCYWSPWLGLCSLHKMRQDRLQPYGATVAPSPTTSTIRHTIAIRHTIWHAPMASI